MNPAISIARWYRRAAGDAPSRGDRYTVEEVRDLLTTSDFEQSQRAREAREAAAVTGDWLAYLDKGERRLLGELADRLPALVYLHGIGTTPEQLRARFGGLTAWRYERALDVAYACIAARLNGRRAAGTRLAAGG